MTEQMATTEQVAEFLQLDPGTLRKWRMKNTGPTAYVIGNKARYDMDEVKAWVKQQTSGDAEPRFSPAEWAQLAQRAEAEGSDLLTVVACEHSQWATRCIDADTKEFHCSQCSASVELLEDLGAEVRCSCGEVFNMAAGEGVGGGLANHWTELESHNSGRRQCPEGLSDCTCTH